MTNSSYTTGVEQLAHESQKGMERLSFRVQAATPQGVARSRNEFITVVSGLPRSGTSMLMQMLDAADYPCLTDGVRKADADNPHGYFEYEKVKRLRQDWTWLPEAKGKAVKIITQLIPFLPPQFSYRVIFIERNISEVLASQRVMLQRQGKSDGNLSDVQLGNIFERQVREVKRVLAQRGTPILDVAYLDALQRPIEVAEKIQGFLGENLDVCAMAAAIDPNLYRQRCK